jgi:hypothetical protein
VIELYYAESRRVLHSIEIGLGKCESLIVLQFTSAHKGSAINGPLPGVFGRYQARTDSCKVPALNREYPHVRYQVFVYECSVSSHAAVLLFGIDQAIVTRGECVRGTKSIGVLLT